MKPFEPFEFQKADVEYLSKNNFTGLLAMEPGAGKTATALLSHRESGAKVTLIVAPEATHKTAWKKGAEWILGETPRVIGNTGKDKKAAMEDFKLGYPGLYLASPQMLTRAKDITEWMGDLCIIDEGHMLNRPGSQGQKQMQKLADTFPMRMLLSGTAWRNNFERAWSVARFLWPHLYLRDEVSYDNNYLWKSDRLDSVEIYTSRRDRNGNPVKVKKFTNEKEPGLFVTQAPCVIIHKKREECCDFHTIERQGFAGFLNIEEPQVIEHEVDLTPKQKRAIDELEEQYLAFLEDNALLVDLPITLSQRIRQICLGEPEVEDYEIEDEFGETQIKQRLWFKDDCKSPFYEELVEILKENDDNVTVYLESQTFAEVVTRRLNKDGFPAFEFSGKTKKTRMADLEQYGKKYRVAVIVISAGGVGLDGLQSVSATEVHLETSPDDSVNIQTSSRQDRLGGKGQVQRHYIHDSTGRSRGRLSEQLERRMALNETLRRA